MSNDVMVLGQEGGDHIALRFIDRVDPPDWMEPAISFEVTGTSTGVRFRTFETLVAVEDLKNFLDHLREAETDNTAGGFLQSANQEVSVKLRGQGTGTIDLDCEISDNPELRKPTSRSLVLYPRDLSRLIRQVEQLLAKT